MKEFEYVIKDPNGIHARPAGILVKESSKFQSQISISKDDKKADAKKIFSVMGLGVKSGDKVKITVEGEDEEQVFEFMQEFMQNNL